MTTNPYTDESWRGSASCSQVDPSLWFPEKGDHGNEARRVCQTCPVFAECEEYAVVTVQRHGIWAGKNEHELRQIRTQRGLSEPKRRIPIERVAVLAGWGWPVELIAAEVGFDARSVFRALKRFRENEAAA